MASLFDGLVNAKISRRGFLGGVAAASLSTSMVEPVVAAVEPYVPGGPMPDNYVRSVTGTGADLLVEQLLETGARYLFVANGSGLGPICDALVDHPGLQLIQATQEGQVASMADGYAKASGQVGFGFYSRVGLPHSTSNMYNAMKDRTPIVLMSDHAETDVDGRDGHEDLDDYTETVKEFTKWRWLVQHADRIPEWLRKGYQMSKTLPGGPTVLRFPRNLLLEEKVTATIYSGQALNIPVELPPNPQEVERAARFLLSANSPLMQVGFEVSQCNAQDTVVELAELLAIPVVQHNRSFHCDFPNFHPLYIDHLNNVPSYLRTYQKPIDCFLSLGTRFPQGGRSFIQSVPIIHATVEAEQIGRNTPLAGALIGHINLTARALIDSIKSMTTPEQLKKLTADRRARCSDYTTGVHAARIESGRLSKGNPVPWQRLMYELNDLMDPNGVVVEELGEAARTLTHFRFGKGAKLKIGRTTGMALGWGVGASAGVKIALPDRQVVSIQGDGGFLFGQTDSLWTHSRYDIPVMTVMLNNSSYEATRWRIMHEGGRAGLANRDYVSYLGNPEVSFTGLAAAYNIKGEVVSDSEQLRAAIQRGLRTLAEGRPYMLDVKTRTWGLGSELTEYQKFSVARDLRTRDI